MHLQLKASFSDHNSLIDMGVGIVSGGLGGVAVRTLTALHIYLNHNVAFSDVYYAYMPRFS